MKSESVKIEDIGEIKSFEVVRQTVSVAIYFWEYSNVPYGMVNSDRNELVKQVSNMSGLDKSKPVRLYTIIL